VTIHRILHHESLRDEDSIEQIACAEFHFPGCKVLDLKFCDDKQMLALVKSQGE
jgi:hypothetical protein